jgi:hypothetical protein
MAGHGDAGLVMDTKNCQHLTSQKCIWFDQNAPPQPLGVKSPAMKNYDLACNQQLLLPAPTRIFRPDCGDSALSRPDCDEAHSYA